MTRLRRIAYSDAEMRWLESNRSMVISDYHRAFCEAFKRTDVTASHLHGLRKRKGWKIGRDPARYVGRQAKYLPEHLAWLSNHSTLSLTECHRQFTEAFPQIETTPEKLHSLRKRKGIKTGRTGYFVKGQVPLNKGKTCPPGVGGRHPNAQRTQFKKKHLPHNFRGDGHERIDSKDGYIVMIVAEKNPWTGADTRPVHKHRWLWEQKNGPVPEVYALKCLDGDKQNTDPSNWEAVPRAVLARLNGGRHKKRIAYDAAPAELKPTIMAVAKLEHKIREAAE